MGGDWQHADQVRAAIEGADSLPSECSQPPCAPELNHDLHRRLFESGAVRPSTLKSAFAALTASRRANEDRQGKPPQPGPEESGHGG